MEAGPHRTEGLRERKRRETRLRIAQQGLRLFASHGYDGTTLEAVAEASGISPRTLFHHFKSKDEILQFWKGTGFVDRLRQVLLAQPVDQSPLAAVRQTLFTLIPEYETEQTVVVDRILNSTEALRIRKQAFYIQLEQLIFETLCELWPDPERQAALRFSAMIGIGALRLAYEARRNTPDPRPLVDHLRSVFAMLDSGALA